MKCQNCCEHKKLVFIKETQSVQCKECGKVWSGYNNNIGITGIRGGESVTGRKYFHNDYWWVCVS